MKISIIVAMAENHVIGSGGKIPWRLSADFKRFKEITLGHPVVMGRKTFESIGKPLPERTNIVISRDPNYKAAGCLTAQSLEEAISLAKSADEVFIIGGEQVYKMALPKAGTVYLTMVHGTFEGDAFFPALDGNKWQLLSSEDHKKDDKNSADFTYFVYKRKNN
ncbi:MAG: dihydrofolate reductase [Patescibacteria group bacterium]